jgi:hypothetical protein
VFIDENGGGTRGAATKTAPEKELGRGALNKCRISRRRKVSGHELQNEPQFRSTPTESARNTVPAPSLSAERESGALLLGIKAAFGDVNFAKSESFHNLAAHVFSFAFQYLVKISALYAILPRKSSLATLKFNHGSQEAHNIIHIKNHGWSSETFSLTPQILLPLRQPAQRRLPILLYLAVHCSDCGSPKSFGSLAIFTTIRLASFLASIFAADTSRTLAGCDQGHSAKAAI